MRKEKRFRSGYCSGEKRMFDLWFSVITKFFSGNAYLRCFYFMAAIATKTGNNPSPTNVIEYGYMIFSWMFGVFVFALLLGQIRDIVYNANKNVEEFRSTMDKALSECKRLDLPPAVTDKVRRWFIYTWEQQKTLG